MNANTTDKSQVDAAYHGVQEVYRKFVALHSARQMLQLKGMKLFICPDEHAILCARILTDLGLSTGRGFEFCMVYGHDGLPLPEPIDLGGVKTPQTEREYNLLNVHVAGLLDHIARGGDSVAALWKLLQDDADRGAQVRCILRQIIKYSPVERL